MQDLFHVHPVYHCEAISLYQALEVFKKLLGALQLEQENWRLSRGSAKIADVGCQPHVQFFIHVFQQKLLENCLHTYLIILLTLLNESVVK